MLTLNGIAWNGSDCLAQDAINSIAVSHDGQWVVSGSCDSQVRFWDAKTGAVQLILRDRSVRGPFVPAQFTHWAVQSLKSLLFQPT